MPRRVLSLVLPHDSRCRSDSTPVESRTNIWKRPSRTVHSALAAMGTRKTRFISLLNLKGGVGKTTLTANLAACMALGDRPLRVLLVDVDFQGTLSDVCADPQLVELQLKNGSTVVRLLGAGGSNGDLASLMTPMSQVPGAKVILANDELEAEDYRLQAEYFVNKDREVRYLFRNLLHRESVYNQFDLVLFDCPPRLTTSAVNALACSDYVLIPTKLDPGSINAVPRTLRWLDELAGVVPAQLLGVVVNQATHRVGKLTRADQNSYTYLCAVVAQCKAGNNGFVFQATVKSDAKIVPTDRGLVASIEKENRELFIPLVTELRERIQI